MHLIKLIAVPSSPPRSKARRFPFYLCFSSYLVSTMKTAAEKGATSRQSRLLLPSTRICQPYNQAKKSHPFQHAALVTKDQVRAFQRPASEVWLGLTTTMWLQTGLNELPISHPMHSTLLDRLQKEPPSPSSPSSSSRSIAPLSRKSMPQFDKLPAEIRQMIYGYSLSESQPISPYLRALEELPSPLGGDYIKSGLPVLAQVFPQLADEIQAMMRPFYQANTFQFDLREEDGVKNLSRWVEQRHDEARVARTISVVHWTWYWSSSDSCWNFVADATILSLTSTGHIKLARTAGTLDPDSCNCSMDDLVSSQCSDWTMNKTWTMTDFVKALRQDEELLTQALTKFVDLIHHHDESFHAWRNGPKACTACGKSMIFLRTFDDVEWTSE